MGTGTQNRGWARKQLVLMQRLEAGSREFWERKQPEDVSGGAGELAQGGTLPRRGAGGRVAVQKLDCGWAGAGCQSGHEPGRVPAPLIHIFLIC